jgi:hypothetical protein
VAEPDAEKTAKEFIDGSLAARTQLGYSAKVSKRSYGQAVKRVAGVFERLRATIQQTPDGNMGSPPAGRPRR